MARIARVKVEGGGAFYHVCARIAGNKGEYPQGSKLCRPTIIDIIERFSKVYCCQVVGFCIWAITTT